MKRFGLTPIRYYQEVTMILDTQVAHSIDPVTVRRLRESATDEPPKTTKEHRVRTLRGALGALAAVGLLAAGCSSGGAEAPSTVSVTIATTMISTQSVTVPAETISATVTDTVTLTPAAVTETVFTTVFTTVVAAAEEPADISPAFETQSPPAATEEEEQLVPQNQPPTEAYYENCAAARAAGAAPLHRGDAGYRSGLDRDNDGIACE